jgi:hypothetical protein
MVEIHIVSTGTKWAVKKRGNKRATRLFKTRHAAENFGLRLATAQDNALLVVHNSDGSVYSINRMGTWPI